ncbi:hypothetical protein OSTOST_15658 [Ostertagia ostertagi]
MLTVCALPTLPCQHFHTHYSKELVCNETNICTLEYEQELFFNKLHKEACVMLRYRNHTVGKLKFTFQRARQICNKQTLFYTRDTSAKVFYEKRCPFMGSCLGNKCRTLQQDESIPELYDAEKFPGYSMCSSTCAGLACGCLTPFPGCLFYRVAQVPKSEAIYHIFKCASWNPEIHISLETTFTGTTTSNPLQLHPYVSKMIDGWDIKVTSLQHIIHAALSKRFAESAAGFKMLGDAFKIAVECPDENTARKHFANCSNEVVCSCSHTMAAAQCVCPQNSFQEPQNSTTNLPAIEPHLNITASETVMIDTDDTEVTLLVTSKNQFQMAQVVVDPPCSMHATSITGCYDCSEGAKATVYCRSDSSSDITLECTDQTFLIGCSKQTKPNVLKLQYDHADVKDICSFRCGGKTSKIDLSGTLFYHTPTLDHEIFEGDTKRTASNGNWWNNLAIPDISPLLGTITKHWKITAAVIGGFTVIGLLVYFLGPTVIIAIIRILTAIILALLRTFFECVTNLLSLLRRYRNE